METPLRRSLAKASLARFSSLGRPRPPGSGRFVQPRSPLDFRSPKVALAVGHHRLCPVQAPRFRSTPVPDLLTMAGLPLSNPLPVLASLDNHWSPNTPVNSGVWVRSRSTFTTRAIAKPPLSQSSVPNWHPSWLALSRTRIRPDFSHRRSGSQ